MTMTTQEIEDIEMIFEALLIVCPYKARAILSRLLVRIRATKA